MKPAEYRHLTQTTYDRKEAEDSLAWVLTVNKIGFRREVQFYPPRKWRFDFVLEPYELLIAIEVEGGSWTGGHRHGSEADKDCEKSNCAVREGWKVLRVTPGMVRDGRALLEVERALGRDL